jgi:hypothetical protein
MTHWLHGRLRIAAALLLCTMASLHASSPKFFRAATQNDFLKGDAENLSIDSAGQLVLGPATELAYETPSPFLWTVTPSPDGSLFLGTGNDGRVYRVDSSGRGSVFFDAAELEVHAMTPAPNGGLYVGTSPDGRIYKLDRNGKATPFFDPDEKYIWSLATDAKGNLFAATGEGGIVYKITPDGKGEAFYRTKATNATVLLVDPAGNLIVGTETPGRVMRVDDQGRGFLLLDSPYQEIRTLRPDGKGGVYVGAVNGRSAQGLSPSLGSSGDQSSTPSAPPDPNRAPVPTVTVTTEVTSVGGADSGGATTTTSGSRSDSRSVKGGVYRIASDGLWDLLWESRDDSPYDVLPDREGRLLVATGPKGKILRLEGQPLRPMLLGRASAQQVTALWADARGTLFYATANPGKLFKLSSERAPRGTYESEVLDAQMVSSWGTLAWRANVPAGGTLELATRSGNTEVPDDTWSPWSAPYTVTTGSPIVSPKARYIQWRAVLGGKGDGPVLTSVTAAYLQRNLRPQVRSITVHPPGIVFQKPYSAGDPELAGFDGQSTPDQRLTESAQNASSTTPSLGRRTYEKGLQTLVWRADDENGDDLSYELLYRREGDRDWKVLRKDLGESIYVWDTTTVPNGTYFVKVVASDAPANGIAEALAGDLESAAFQIDNTAPEIALGATRTSGTQLIVPFDVKDDASAVQRVEYSLDGLTWRSVFPTDGIADSPLEHYELTVDGPIGVRGVTLRASDAMNNVATAQVVAGRVR